MIARFLVWLMFGFAVAMLVSIAPDFFRMIFPRHNRKRRQTKSKYPFGKIIRRA